jgi:predicted porin
MRRRLLVAAIWGGACAIAQAQSNVTIYGLVDLSVGAARNGNGTVYNVSSGVGNSSRLGSEGRRTWEEA